MSVCRLCSTWTKWCRKSRKQGQNGKEELPPEVLSFFKTGGNFFVVFLRRNQKQKEMEEIKLYGGCSIEMAYNKLSNQGKECFARFNGHILTSDDTLDIMYLKVTGKTKEEFDKQEKEWIENYRRKEEEFKKKIPEMTEQYVKEAEGVILPDKLDYWKKIVPVRLSDIYHGIELDQTLNISRIMGDESIDIEERLKKSYEIFNEYGHSGCSAGLTMAMLEEFCPNGNEITKAIREFRYDEN